MVRRVPSSTSPAAGKTSSTRLWRLSAQTTGSSDEVTAVYHAKYHRYGPAPVGAVTGNDCLETLGLIRATENLPYGRPGGP
jgi:hypothetical protein